MEIAYDQERDANATNNRFEKKLEGYVDNIDPDIDSALQHWLEVQECNQDTVSGPDSDIFPWNDLPPDIQLKISKLLTIGELLHFQEANVSPWISNELGRRIYSVQILWKKWCDAPLEHRNIKKYRLRENRFACTPAEFVEMNRLVLGSTGITELPQSISEFTNLVVLYLDENNLSSIPEELSQCKHLKVLDLMGNKFTDCPHVIKDLPQLTYFTLSFNSTLSSLPEDIGLWLPKLRGFGAYGCNLESLPESLLQRLSFNEDAFANIQYNRFNMAYIRDIVARYPTLKRKIALV